MKKILMIGLIGLILMSCGCARQQANVSNIFAEEAPLISSALSITDISSSAGLEDESEYIEGCREPIEYDRLRIAEDKDHEVYVYKRYPKGRLLSYVNEKDDSLGLEVVINQHVIYHPELDCFEAEVAVRKWKQKEVALIMYNCYSGPMSWEFLLIHDMKTMAELPVPSQAEINILYNRIKFDEKRNKLDMSAFDSKLIAPDFDYSVMPQGEESEGDTIDYWINVKDELVVYINYKWPMEGIFFFYDHNGEDFILKHIERNRKNY